MDSKFDQFEYYPALVFGLAAPIGADIEYVEKCICDALSGFKYVSTQIKITKIMQDLDSQIKIDESSLYRSYDTKIKAANQIF